MKYFFSLIAFTVLVSFRPVEDIYSIALKSIDGTPINLAQYRGKKMLFIVLPLSAQDTAVTVSQIGQLQTKYQGSLIVIGIPAMETGFQKGTEAVIKKLYKDAGANIIITEGMNIRKGQKQSALFQWLTSKDKNRHFNQDVQGIGSKFFVDEKGELYGVLGPGLKLTNPIMDRIIARQSKH